MSTLTQPIKWHGGKHYLAKKIVALMPPHTRYLEAFAGGLSVLLAKPCEGIAEWVNDTNGELANFWAALRSEIAFKKFLRWCESQPLEQRAFESARSYKHIPLGSHDDADAFAAFQFFVRMRQSRQGLGKDFCTPTRRTRRGMNEQVSAWLTAVDGLPDIHARLRRVEVWSRSAVDAIRKLDGPDLLVYADPPYVHETRSSTGEYGEHEMSEADHVELLSTLANMEGMFVLSGYRSELYDCFSDQHGWGRVDFDLPNNASGKKSKERKTECVWKNR